MRFAGILCGVWLSLAGSAWAWVGSYAREHAAWCAAHMDTEFARQQCVTRNWCAAHWNDDRITRISCDPMRTHADLRLSRITLSPAGLAGARDLSPTEIGFPLPTGMRTAKLALRAEIYLGPFPRTEVLVGIASATSGAIAVNWGSRNERAALNAREIAALLTALNQSDFWRSPHEPRHQGALDGEIADVVVAIASRQNQVHDAIGNSEAVDLSILVNALSPIIGSHWSGVPGGT